MRLNELAKEIKQRKNITLSFSDQLVEQIASKGHDPDSNARQIRRMCDELVRGCVAQAIVHWPQLNNFHQSGELHFELKDAKKLQLSFDNQQLVVPVNEALTELEI